MKVDEAMMATAPMTRAASRPTASKSSYMIRLPYSCLRNGTGRLGCANAVLTIVCQSLVVKRWD